MVQHEMLLFLQNVPLFIHKATMLWSLSEDLSS